MDELHLFYTSDQVYLTPTYVSICSALHHTQNVRALYFHVLDCGIDDLHWSRFVGLLKDKFRNMRDVVRHIVDVSMFSQCRAYGGSLATYARILPSRLLLNRDWCLFVDGDVLFVADPLSIVRYQDASKLVIGHDDYDLPELFAQWNKVKADWFRSNGLKWDPNQFVCMGFVLMNLKLMRTVGFVDRCLKAFRNLKDSKTADQEAINYVCQGKIGYLPPEWGTFNLSLSRHRFVPASIHYVYSKPWKIGCAWTRIIPDADRLWLRYARNVAGMRWREFAAEDYFTYLKKIFLQKVIFLASRLPVVSRKFRVHRRLRADSLVWRKLIKECDHGRA